MNEDTDYVHTAVINYEPTYLVLENATRAWEADQNDGIAEYRDFLRETVEYHVKRHPDQIGLRPDDLTDDVDYAAMIEWELEHA